MAVAVPPEKLQGRIDDAALDGSGFGYGAAVDYLLEQIEELRWPFSIRTYAAMRHEPQLAAVLQAYILPINRATWSVDGAGCRDEVTQRIADDLGLPVKGTDTAPSGARRRRFSWSAYLPIVMRLRETYGHSFNEQAWDVVPGGYRLGAVQERMPQTIAALRLNPDGTLKSVEQEAFIGQRPGPPLTTADHRLVYYTRQREGSNYFGQSLLRASYGPWLIKGQMLRVHATSIRRFGMGIPEVQAPPGAMPQQIAEAQRLASAIKGGDDSGVGLPAGYTLNLRGLQGSVPDVVAFITYLDRLMTRSTLTSILDMATAERGARSLGETVMDLMTFAQQSDAEQVAEESTSQIVVPLVDANWGEDEPAPRIDVSDVGQDVQLTAQDMNWLLQYGGLNPDDTLEEHTRQRYGLPPIDRDTRRIEITEQPPAAPSAPVDPNAPEVP